MNEKITRDDILSMDEYGKVRAARRSELMPVKQKRRVPVGPDATFYFESRETMWLQIHEMLFIERGGEEQIEDELSAYNPLIPGGDELVATVMVEIPDANRRRQVLAKLGGFEETMKISFDGEDVLGQPETDVDRTTADGKASSVQFLHFKFTPEQAAKFRQEGTEVMVSINHPNYTHLAKLSEESRAELARDLTV